jgi:hypothetical protein
MENTNYKCLITKYAGTWLDLIMINRANLIGDEVEQFELCMSPTILEFLEQ